LYTQRSVVLDSHFVVAKTFLPLIGDKKGSSFTFIAGKQWLAIAFRSYRDYYTLYLFKCYCKPLGKYIIINKSLKVE